MARYRERSRLISNYLIILGIVNLIGLNLGGLLWFWFAGKLRERNNRFRIATLILCGISVALGIACMVDMLWRGTSRCSIRSYGYVYNNPPLWMVGLFFFVFVLIHALPLVWLTRPGTVYAFTHQSEMATSPHCSNCQYNLSANVSGTCPECGAAIEMGPAVNR